MTIELMYNKSLVRLCSRTRLHFPWRLRQSKMAVANTGSRVDTIYRAAIQAPKFFTKGWGDVRLLERIFKLMKQTNYPKGESWKCGDGSLIDQCYGICRQSDIKLLGSGKNGIADVFEYEFRSPLNTILPGSLPKESEKVRFQLVIPHGWFNGRGNSNTERRPLCIHLAGTGDHFYWRRRHFMALPLVKENDVASIIVENPFYGSRKPKGQNKSGLRHVSDLLVMGAALTFEVMALLNWCEKQGYGPLAVTGISMGGHMASISAAVWNKPIAIVPCLSWSTAAPVFTKVSPSVAYIHYNTFTLIFHAIDYKIVFKIINEKSEAPGCCLDYKGNLIIAFEYFNMWQIKMARGV